MADERARSRRAGGPPGLRTAAVHGALDAFAARRSAELGRSLRVLDLGGGTGGTAVPLAVAGHDVTVVDPSPDALASLRRRTAALHELIGRSPGAGGRRDRAEEQEHDPESEHRLK